MNDYDSRQDTFNHIRDVQENLLIFCVEFLERGINHDDSKLYDPEKPLFDEYTPKLKDCTYGSDEYKKYLAELKVALDHHYAENSHHPEHYPKGIENMNLFDIIEMFCDWNAATKRHKNGNIIKSIEINTERFAIDSQLSKILFNTAFFLEHKDQSLLENIR